MKKLRVGLLGATGIVGRCYARQLDSHPYFELTFLSASPKSSSMSYQKALQLKNCYEEGLSLKTNCLVVHDTKEVKTALKKCDFVFSALDSESAFKYETLYASLGLPVLSNASCHRQDPLTPILIPEINPEHLNILPIQQRERGWDSGFIVTKSNCSLHSYLMPLFPLHTHFKIKKLRVTTMQSISGAGYPGLSALDLLGNVIPYIAGEEEKSKSEPLKILGHLENSQITPLSGLDISVQCNRVPVLEGHMASVSVQFEKKPKMEEVLDLWENFKGEPQTLGLPSAPKQPIHYLFGSNRPQPRLDLLCEKGMAVTVGRLQNCSVLDYSFVGLSHNVLRGAALGGILNAELLYQKGYLKSRASSLASQLQSKKPLNRYAI